MVQSSRGPPRWSWYPHSSVQHSDHGQQMWTARWWYFACWAASSGRWTKNAASAWITDYPPLAIFATQQHLVWCTTKWPKSRFHIRAKNLYIVLTSWRQCLLQSHTGCAHCSVKIHTVLRMDRLFWMQGYLPPQLNLVIKGKEEVCCLRCLHIKYISTLSWHTSTQHTEGAASGYSTCRTS